ncbi:MAG: methylenetetrahydrofolate reductase [Eggerthellaceae bacterium]|nr:methylenetetrahydrofolate reductase [Eggerthellaceae bacterium]
MTYIHEVLERSTHENPAFSFEIFPPKGDLAIEQARTILGDLRHYDPAFISVTYSAGGTGNSDKTIDIARMGSEEFNVRTMAHLTCVNSSKQDIDQVIERMKHAGIKNVLALRGDLREGCQTSDFSYAKDLIPLLRDAGFSVGAAASTEGHIDCLDFNTSLEHLKEKQDAGAQFFVTQLFFDNEYALRFAQAAEDAGITVPITYGIMPFLSKNQVSRMIFMCGASLPSAIIKLLNRYDGNDEDLRKAGIEYACQQLIDLHTAGITNLHGYIMNQPDIAQSMHAALTDVGIL